MRELFAHVKPKRVHVQAFSEFSGAGTAEVSLKALASAASVCMGSDGPNPLSVKVMRQSDWDKTAQTALINNSDVDTRTFGDIMDMCSEEMKQKANRKVAVEATGLLWFNILVLA